MGNWLATISISANQTARSAGIYLRSAASNPKALSTAYSDYQKCYWGSARMKRLTEQPKMWTQ